MAKRRKVPKNYQPFKYSEHLEALQAAYRAGKRDLGAARRQTEHCERMFGRMPRQAVPL